jgi:hypothetical protein
VYNNGTFVMTGGEISNNIGAIGSGVSNLGVFSLSRGTISKNIDNGLGSSTSTLFTSGTFNMMGGVISDGMVCNRGLFSMSGGTISNSKNHGVYNEVGCSFILSGGEISNNAGFGVYNLGTYNWGWTYGMFSMSGGIIRNNACGVQSNGNFSMSGGEIFNNVGGNGGGVQNSNLFSMSGGKISNNQATKGGGVYNYRDGVFSLSKKGVIFNNTAELGGGVYSVGTFNRLGGEISGNTATQYSNIYSQFDMGDLSIENSGSSAKGDLSMGNDGVSDDRGVFRLMFYL